MRSVLLFLILIISLLPIAAAAQQQKPSNADAVLRARSQEYMTARQARKGEAMSRFYDVEDIKKINDFLKYEYVSIKEDFKKGLFTKAYIENSLDSSSFGESYKVAITNYLFKNADFDKELAQAFPRYLTEYKYVITKFSIGSITCTGDCQQANVEVIEYRTRPGVEKPIGTPHPLKWKLKNGVWYLSTDDPANL